MTAFPRLMRVRAGFWLALCLLATGWALLLPACKRFSFENEILIPATSPLSRSVIGYGVINTNYTRILDKRGGDGRSIGFLRKGSIVEILERRPVVTNNMAEIWVLASGSYEGWLKESELQVYPSKAQAVTASQILPQ